MYKFDAHELVQISHLMGQIEGLVRNTNDDIFLPDELINAAPANLNSLKSSLINVHLDVSAGFVDLMLEAFSKKKNFLEIAKTISQLQSSIVIELKQRNFIGLTSIEHELYNQTKPHMGQEVADKFPSALYEIDEAGKCLALGRATATVFHLMRILEISICAIHHCLSINVPLVGNNRNWGSILKRIREEIREKDKQNSYQWKDKDNFQDIYARLDAIKDAWRNKTMHVEIKYTEAEAQYLFDTTNAFMQKIASKMDENGVLTP